MSQHVIEDDVTRWVFGWKRKELSFFVRKYSKKRDGTADLIFQLGDHRGDLPELDDLLKIATMTGLVVPETIRVKLHQARDQDRKIRFVVYPEHDLVSGIALVDPDKTERFREELEKADPQRNYKIRRMLVDEPRR